LLVVLARDPRRLLCGSRHERALAIVVTLLLGVGVLQLLPLGPLLGVISPGTAELLGPSLDVSSTVSVYPHATRAVLAVWVAAAVVALTAARGVRSLREARFVAAAIVLSATGNAAVAAFGPWLPESLAFGNTLPVLGVAWSRSMGSFGSPNHLAGFCALALPLCLGLALGPGARVRRRSLLWLVPAALLASGVLLSVSRSGALAACAGILAFAGFAEGARQRLLGPRLVAVGMVAVGVVVGISPLAERFSHAGTKEAGRLALWQGAVDIAGQVPVLGSGLGTYRQVAPAYVETWKVPNTAHNDYLNLMSDAGLFGAALGACAVGLFWLLVRRGLQRLPMGRRRMLLAGAAGGAIALLAASLFEFNLQIPANLWAFAAACGLALAIGRLGQTSRTVERTWRTTTLSLALLAAAGLLASTALRQGAPEWRFAQASGLEGAERIEALRSASTWDPERADFHADLGVEHLPDRDEEWAVQAFSAACRREPRNARHHLGLAQALLARGRFVRAQDELRVAEALAPYFPRYRLHAGVLALHSLRLAPPDERPEIRRRALASLSAAAQDASTWPGVVDAAIAQALPLSELLQIAPETRTSGQLRRNGLVLLARRLHKAGRTVDAARALSPVAQAAAVDVPLLLEWATLEVACGNGDLGASGFRRAARATVGGRRRSVLARARQVLVAAGYADSALALLWELSAQFPKDSDVLVELGLALLGEKAPDQAVHVFERARALGLAESHRHLAAAYARAGRPRSAREALRAALRVARGPKAKAALLVKIAASLSAERRHEEARVELERALRLYPSEAAVTALEGLPQ
jgi:Flp pilus assembly protein TadD